MREWLSFPDNFYLSEKSLQNEKPISSVFVPTIENAEELYIRVFFFHSKIRYVK